MLMAQKCLEKKIRKRIEQAKLKFEMRSSLATVMRWNNIRQVKRDWKINLVMKQLLRRRI